MNGASARFSNSCLTQKSTQVRVGVRSAPKEIRFLDSTKHDRIEKMLQSEKNEFSDDVTKMELIPSRRIMIVIESSLEAKGALRWALSHTVQNQDTVVFLYVYRSSKQGEKRERKVARRAYELSTTMKNICLQEKPEVEVEILVVGGNEKGPTIVEEVKKQNISLLVLGQRKRCMLWRLQNVWIARRNHERSNVIEYCIQNSDCMTLAVRKKSRREEGYLITTKRHKDFWLLV